MSGGHFNYVNDYLQSELFGYKDRPTNVLEDREISELVWDVLQLIHTFDWYKSGDTGKETYMVAKEKFKKKWFDDRGDRVQRVVDTALQEVREELYETFNLKT